MNKTLIFDLGGVLIDWNPRHLYRSVFDRESDMNFLDNICTNDWNELQDSGRSIAEATAVLCNHFPEHTDHIKLYYDQWEKMLYGPIDESVHILKSVKDQGYRILALTNWSAETFPIALKRFDFLHWFEDVLVSGEIKMKKPDPAIFNLLVKRYKLDPKESVFIDDNIKNVAVSKTVGLDGIHFTTPYLLTLQLAERGIRIPD